MNECTTGTHNCQQECVNTVGSFNCKCFFGFELNADRRTCTKGKYEVEFSSSEPFYTSLLHQLDLKIRCLCVHLYMSVTPREYSCANISLQLLSLSEKWKKKLFPPNIMSYLPWKFNMKCFCEHLNYQLPEYCALTQQVGGILESPFLYICPYIHPNLLQWFQLPKDLIQIWCMALYRWGIDSKLFLVLFNINFLFHWTLPFPVYWLIEKIFVKKKNLAPNIWIDFIFGLWLHVDGAYVVHDFGCSLISTFCTSGSMPITSMHAISCLVLMQQGI